MQWAAPLMSITVNPLNCLWLISNWKYSAGTNRFNLHRLCWICLIIAIWLNYLVLVTSRSCHFHLIINLKEKAILLERYNDLNYTRLNFKHYSLFKKKKCYRYTLFLSTILSEFLAINKNTTQYANKNNQWKFSMSRKRTCAITAAQVFTSR